MKIDKIKNVVVELLKHIDDHKEAYKKEEWTNFNIVNAWFKMYDHEVNKLFVQDSCFVIMKSGMPLHNKLFESNEAARNYIKMQYSKRKFNEIEDGVFKCKQFGTYFKVTELKP